MGDARGRKLQTPNSKLRKNSKLQTPIRGRTKTSDASAARNRSAGFQTGSAHVILLAADLEIGRGTAGLETRATKKTPDSSPPPIGVWSLEFFWSLEFGVWSFSSRQHLIPLAWRPLVRPVPQPASSRLAPRRASAFRPRTKPPSDESPPPRRWQTPQSAFDIRRPCT
jgi:hypothetical protein